jgi:protein-disulfide isomerase
MKSTLADYPRDVKIMYRHLPLETIHPHARTAAMAAECAGAQGRFPAYHDLLYSHQDSIGTISWTDLAVRAGVASSREFEECLAQERFAGEVERDVLLAKELNVTSTPTFIIGDEAYTGVPPAAWIKRQIARTKRLGG